MDTLFSVKPWNIPLFCMWLHLGLRHFHHESPFRAAHFDRGGGASANAEQTPDSIWRHRDFVLILIIETQR